MYILDLDIHDSHIICNVGIETVELLCFVCALQPKKWKGMKNKNLTSKAFVLYFEFLTVSAPCLNSDATVFKKRNADTSLFLFDLSRS